MKRETIATIIEDLQAGRTPVLAVEDFPAFSDEATAGDPHIGPETLQAIAATLTEADIPTFERALRAMDEGDLAWLGFKVVYDAAAAQGNVDNEVTKKYGEQGSADGEPLVFFCNDAKEIVASRELSPRDTFQAKDVTRGPSMHNDQFDGLTWASEPLFGKVRVWLLGASDAAVEVAQLADHARAYVRPGKLHLGAAERGALRGHDGVRGEELYGARPRHQRGHLRGRLGSREAPHRAQVRRKDPG